MVLQARITTLTSLMPMAMGQQPQFIRPWNPDGYLRCACDGTALTPHTTKQHGLRRHSRHGATAPRGWGPCRAASQQQARPAEIIKPVKEFGYVRLLANITAESSAVEAHKVLIRSADVAHLLQVWKRPCGPL